MSESQSPSWVFEHPEREFLIVTGPDRVSWLNGLVTCDVQALTPDQGGYGLALTRTGKIQSDLWLVADPQRLLVAVAAAVRPALQGELDRMLIMEDAELSSADDLCCLTLHGPSAEQALDALLPELLPTALGRIALSGEQDWLLAVERVRVQQWRRAGAPLAGGTRLGDAAQWHDWRVEHGLPEFGVDFGSADNPHDASLERRAVSWSKGCYLGQEVVCMQDMRGKPKRRLVSLLLADGEVPPPSTAVVDAAGEKLGEVTSAAFSRARARAVAIARVVAGAADGQGSGLFVAGKPAQLFAAAKPAL